MRVLITVGPGDVVSHYKDWKNGIRTLTETSMTYSGQSVEYCHQHGIDADIISYNSRVEVIDDGHFYVENRPKEPHGDLGGWRYHAREIRYTWSLARSARRRGCKMAMIDSGTTHWFSLWIFKAMGIGVVANFHNVYFPKGHPPQGLQARALTWLDGLFFRWGLDGIVGNSPECITQARWLAGRSDLPAREYRAQFVAADFEQIAPPPRGQWPFRLIFAGRIEPAKGVFDLLDIAQSIGRRPNAPPIVIEICGSGSALDTLRERVNSRGLQAQVVVHGRLARAELLKVYARSHVVIVPTQSTFCEGMPQVCAEAVLSGRPVITSELANATEVLGPALIEVPPEDIEAYANAIVQLAQQPDTYERAANACTRAATQFLDRSQGVGATIGWSVQQLRSTR